MKYSRKDILGFETDTVWGIGCHPLNKEGVSKIYEIKGREKSKPLILMSNKIDYLLPYVQNIPNYGYELIKKHFPGSLTLIFEKTELAKDYLTSNLNTVGIRIPNHEGFLTLAENFEGHVLGTTSLNFSNQPPVKNYNEAMKTFGNKIKIIKPENTKQIEGVASTVVLCTKENPVVLRQGNVFI